MGKTLMLVTDEDAILYLEDRGIEPTEENVGLVEDAIYGIATYVNENMYPWIDDNLTGTPLDKSGKI